MKTTTIATIALLLALAAPATAQQWYWFTPQAGFSDGDFVDEPGIPTVTVQITPTTTGANLWYYVPLPGLPHGAEIDSLTVCHDILDENTFISQLRLTNVANPNSSTVIHDDNTDITLQGGRCTEQAVAFDFPIEGAVHLGIRVEASNPSAWIEIGGIGVKVTDTAVTVDDRPTPGAKAGAMLDQNSPNPFNPSTTIRFDLPADQRVDLGVYTVDGKRVATLHDGIMGVGAHEVTWNGRDDRGRAMPSGVYLYRLETPAGVESRRMALIR